MFVLCLFCVCFVFVLCLDSWFKLLNNIYSILQTTNFSSDETMQHKYLKCETTCIKRLTDYNTNYFPFNE